MKHVALCRPQLAPVVVLSRHNPLVDGEVEVHIQAGVGRAVLQAPVPELYSQQPWFLLAAWLNLTSVQASGLPSNGGSHA